MKKIFLIPLTCFFIFFGSLAHAQSLKTIDLRDGSRITGTILSLSNNIYTVRTTFGEIQIPENNIVSVQSHNDSPKTSSSSFSKHQIAEYQEKFLKDPDIMNSVQKISQDPEIIDLVLDPDLMTKIMSGNLQDAQDHPNVQKLLQNPKIQNIIDQAGQKFGTGQ